MIKGVARNVIEINNMNSEYFERAIVIIKENCPLDGDELKREADLAIGTPPGFIKRKSAEIKIKMAICTLSGALASVLICGLLYIAENYFQ